MPDTENGYFDDILSSGLSAYAGVKSSTATSIPDSISHLVREERMSTLRAWRIHLEISVRELSSSSGISVPAIELLDRGELSLCLWMAIRIAAALQVVSVQSILATECLVSCRTYNDKE
ncbi:hypothetical protein [Achromobacter sp. Root83]|uniref:hypothetical protein n=1 Tax=Achromobacter sp. Root83 TaxID=1736602 RepID=UPI000B3223FC|nr:hypothetical protein [Achromobacter sp. Root83]